MFKLPFFNAGGSDNPGAILQRPARRTARRSRSAGRRWTRTPRLAGRDGHRERLPLLRRRLRPAHLHQGRPGHRHRGQPAQPDQRRHALPQGGQHLPARRQPAPRQARPVPRAVLRPLGDASRSTGRWTGSPSGSRRRATRASREKNEDGRLLNARHATSARSAGRRWTTKRTTSSRSCSAAGLGVVSIENQARI